MMVVGWSVREAVMGEGDARTSVLRREDMLCVCGREAVNSLRWEKQEHED